MFAVIGKEGTVQDLHLEGIVKEYDYRMVGGICGNNYGTIRNCWVSANVESTHYSAYDADLGGICGWNDSGGKIEYCCMTGNVTNTGGNSGVAGIAGSNDGSISHVTFDGCVFDGSFATTNGTTNCGGYVGWGVYNKPVVTNSLMKPSSVDAGMLIYTFARWYTGNDGIYEPTITNCYYVATSDLPVKQGKQVYASVPANEIYKQQALTDGNYYVPCTVDFWTMYKYTGSDISIAPTVMAADGTVLTADGYGLHH